MLSAWVYPCLHESGYLPYFIGDAAFGVKCAAVCPLLGGRLRLFDFSAADPSETIELLTVSHRCAVLRAGGFVQRASAVFT